MLVHDLKPDTTVYNGGTNLQKSPELRAMADELAGSYEVRGNKLYKIGVDGPVVLSTKIGRLTVPGTTKSYALNTLVIALRILNNRWPSGDEITDYGRRLRQAHGLPLNAPLVHNKLVNMATLHGDVAIARPDGSDLVEGAGVSDDMYAERVLFGLVDGKGYIVEAENVRTGALGKGYGKSPAGALLNAIAKIVNSEEQTDATISSALDTFKVTSVNPLHKTC